MSYSDLKTGVSIFTSLLRKVDEIGPKALSDYVRPATIMGSVVVDISLGDEDIILPLASMLNSFYIGYITTALELNTIIEGGKTVRDALTIVSSNNNYIELLEEVDEKFLSCELTGEYEVSLQADGGKQGNKVEASVFSGKVVELNIRSKEHDRPISIKLIVQLLSRQVQQSVIEQLFAVSNKSTIDQRWTMFKTGEISFWKDFIWERDLVKRHRSALKKDDTGYLFDELQSRSNKLTRNIETSVDIGKVSQNSANNILIVEKRFFTQMVKRLGIKIDDFSSRQRFMSNNYCLIIVVVDIMYSSLEVYFNGIRTKADYSFKAVLSNYGGGGSSKTELAEIMAQFQAGSSPKVF